MSDQSQKVCQITPADLEYCPRITDATTSTDLPEVLSKYRIKVGFKIKSVRPNAHFYGDVLAYEHLSLLSLMEVVFSHTIN